MKQCLRHRSFFRHALKKHLPGLLLPGFFLLGVAPVSTVLAQEATQENPVVQINPIIARLNTAITFYAAFNGQPVADLSVGRGAPTGNSNDLQWTAGKHGQGLQAKNNALIYEATGNIDFAKPGSLAVWVALGARLDREAPVQLGFVTIRHRGTGLALARQGGIKNNESLMAIVGSNINKQETRALVLSGTSKHWEENEWHLLVVNWGTDYVELSIDGGLFKRTTVNSPLYQHTGEAGSMSFAGNGTNLSPYIYDELYIFNRPLTVEESRLIFLRQ